MRTRLLLSFAFFALINSFAVVAQTWQQYSDTAKLFAAKKEGSKAIIYYSLARNVVKNDSGNSATYVQLSRNLAALYNGQSQFKKAAELFEESKLIWEKLFGKDEKYASILNSLAATYNNAGEYKLAEQYFKETRNIRLKLLGDQHADFAQSCNNLGLVYWSIGDFEKAEPLILQGKLIREKLLPARQHPAYAISCTNLANLYRDMGQFENSETLYKEAKEIRAELEPVRRSLDYANSCNILADLYNLNGDYQKAEPLYLEAKEIRAANKYSYAYGESCTNLFALYRDWGNYVKAKSLALEAKNIFDSILSPTDPPLLIMLNNLGELYDRMGEYKEAESYFLKSRGGWEQSLGKEHPYYTSNSNSLARLYWSMGEVSKANQLYQSAFESNFKRIQNVFQFTSETEKTAYVNNITGNADEYFSFYYNKLYEADATQPLMISLQSRSLILASMQKLRSIIYNSQDTILENKFEEWTNQKQSIARLYASPGNINSERLKQLVESANTLEKELSRRSSKFQIAQQTDIDWKLIQQALKPNEAAIEFINFRYHNGYAWTDSFLYAGIVLRKDRLPHMIKLFEKQELDKVIHQNNGKSFELNYYNYRASIDGNDSIIKNLYDLVWKPLETDLIGITKVYFAPAGNLHQLSFAAIPVSDKQNLVDRYQLEQLGSINSITLAANSSISEGDKLEFYGGIDYETAVVDLRQIKNPTDSPKVFETTSGLSRGGKTWSYLPGTKSEILTISKLVKDKKYYIDLKEGLQATEESLKLLQGKLSPKVLHIASHGFFYPDPKENKRTAFQKSFDKSGLAFKNAADPLMRSGLLFAGANQAWQGKSFEAVDDGILTALEVSNLYLPNTKLVVLSACETALGDVKGSEGVYGLQRAFKMAGVQQLIMSLWKVPDNETSEFMQEFYKNYFGGKGVNEAFKVSQNLMKNRYKDEPVKWAAWILVK